ncbi:MAG: GIY-YIG nuclease family protein [Ignavibacteria bacterium]|nr:GIY-YIG nuclease family protein [Ignavibacteria bacterium]
MAKSTAKNHSRKLLIHSYGLFWSPDKVNWGKPNNSGSLEGIAAASKKPVDFRKISAIYILYYNYHPVYIGQVGKGTHSLFSRLKEHRKNLSGRWNMFSWFSLQGVTGANKPSKKKSTFHPSLAVTLDHLEAILIESIEPSLNRQRGKFGSDVIKYEQCEYSEMTASDKKLEEILLKLDSM